MESRLARLVSILIVALVAPSMAAAQEGWQTAEGRACIDRWAQDATSKLNALDGDWTFNQQKPWSINQYGIFVANNIRSNYEPDNWAYYGADRYRWMWAHYPHNMYDPDWRNPNFDRAGIIGLHYFVRHCVAGLNMGGGGGSGAANSGGNDGGSTSGDGVEANNSNSSGPVPAGLCRSSLGHVIFNGNDEGVVASIAEQSTNPGRFLGKFTDGFFRGVWVRKSSGRKCNRMVEGSYYWGRVVGKASKPKMTWQWAYCDDEPITNWGMSCANEGGSSSGGSGGSNSGGVIAGDGIVRSGAIPEVCNRSTSGRIDFTGALSGHIARYGTADGRILGDIINSQLDGYWVDRNAAVRCNRPIDGSHYWGRLIGPVSPTSVDWKWSYCDAPPRQSWNGECSGNGGSQPGGFNAGGAGENRSNPSALIPTGLCTSSLGHVIFNGNDEGEVASIAAQSTNPGRFLGEFTDGYFRGVWVRKRSARKCNRMVEGSYYWGRVVGQTSKPKMTWQWAYCDDQPNTNWGMSCRP